MITVRREHTLCPVLPVSRCTDLLPARRVADARQARRRLTGRRRWRIERVRQDTLDDALVALFELHQARWHARSHPGVLGGKDVRRFLSCVARGLLDRGMLRVYTLRIDERIVCVHYGFQDSRRRFFYIAGFDPALKSLSIGTVLLEQAIRDACAKA